MMDQSIRQSSHQVAEGMISVRNFSHSRNFFMCITLEFDDKKSGKHLFNRKKGLRNEAQIAKEQFSFYRSIFEISIICFKAILEIKY